jgi:hypothetical protein
MISSISYSLGGKDRARIVMNNMTTCSKLCCGNARHHYKGKKSKQLTIKEKIFLEKYKDSILDLDYIL